MEIIPIFAENLSLCAVRYSKDEPDEFLRLMTLWQDPEYLVKFFTENMDKLCGGFWGDITISEAAERTQDFVYDFEEKIECIVFENQLDEYFKDLDYTQYKVDPYSRKKFKLKKNWLRLYAIKVENNHYIITGGAIKLTRTMQEADDTQRELQKIETVRNYLISEGVVDKEGLNDIVTLDF